MKTEKRIWCWPGNSIVLLTPWTQMDLNNTLLTSWLGAMDDNPGTLQTLEKVKRMRQRLEEVAARHPEADPENIWHTLVLLDQEPIERLTTALRRGQISRKI